MRFRLYITTLLLVAPLGAHAQQAPAEPSNEPFNIPFESEEVAREQVRLTLRHRARVSLPEKQVRWNQLELEASNGVRAELLPGEWDTDDESPQQARFALHLRDGEINGSFERHSDEHWVIDADAKITSRDLKWKQPAVDIANLSFEGRLRVDSSLPAPMEMLDVLDVREFSADRIETGGFRLANVKAEGEWTRPFWRVGNLEANTFGGWLALAGFGRWGTNEPAKVSVTAESENLDLHAVLTRFQVPRANEIRAHLTGAARIETTGRHWNQLSADLYAEEGTVFLHRTMIHDILKMAYQYNEKFNRELVEKVLNDEFGSEQMIPFDEMRLEGGLDGEVLHLSLPLKNSAMKLHVEPRIDRPVVWDSYDWLQKMGLENVEGLNLDKSDAEMESERTR